MQPEHPEIDEAVLQEGYEVLSNYSAAFYNRTKTRPPRSVGYDYGITELSFSSDLGPPFVLSVSIPLFIVTLLLILVLRVLRFRF